MREPVKGPTESGRMIKFSAEFDQKPEKAIPVFACLFDRRGQLLAKEAVKDGTVEIPLELVKQPGTRLFFVPFEEVPEIITLPDMERLHAYEPIWELDPKKLNYKLQPFPYDIWKWWLKCKCRVRGQVVKPIIINGTVVDKPVCDARVHICEVDKFWLLIPHLPDHIIWRLRDELVAELKKPPHIPEPDPEIFRWPPPLPDPPRIFPHDGVNWLNPQPEPPLPIENSLPLTDWRTLRVTQAFQSQSTEAVQTTALELKPDILPSSNLTSLDRLPLQTRADLLSASTVTIRKVLADNYKLILPYICLWPWLHPYFCHYDEITTVITNHAGKFDLYITYPCFGDHPDLYFWVEYPVDGIWTTVYKPAYICCHTWWNYVCGTEVILHVTDPRVHWCGEVPDLEGLNVVITTIGNAISMSEIDATPGATMGYTTAGEPFAGTLELRMDLSRSNLIALGVTHYRWSYKRTTKGDGTTAFTDTWHVMKHPVDRFYKVMVPNPTPPPALKPYYPSDRMGPDPAFPGLNLFRIQPVNPPAPGIEWSMINEHVDMAYAYFETASLYESDGVTLASGQYELKLELFNNTGNLVKWNNPTGGAPAQPIYAFMSSNASPFSPPVGMTTVLAPAANLIQDGAGNTWGFKMTVYVDNNPCQAFIYDTWADISTKQAGPCGFILFDDVNTSEAHLRFIASQAYDHGRFLFEVVKGSSGDIPIATAGWNYIGGYAYYAPVGVSPINGYAKSGGIWEKAIKVKDLLNANGFNCTQAAFAETLYVYCTAVNGYSRAYWLDASATPRAFALAPKP